MFLMMLLLSALLFAFASGLTLPNLLSQSYAPFKATCPATPLVRPAIGLSTSEAQYISNRKVKADAGLASWLLKTNSTFGTANLPTVALTTSGGGYRSLLEGAGVIQGFDSRDSDVGTSGLLQGLTYQAGLSGGSWLLSSLAGNNYPTVSSLRDGLWKSAFQNSLLIPANLRTAAAYADVTVDIVAKQNAGFPPTLTDPWGRLLSYQLLYGPDGGVAKTLSGITAESSFTSYAIPYPIITCLGVKTNEGQCLPGPNATTYELTPYEFGSWDIGVSAFTQTRYLGTSLSNGSPSNTSCVENYDNLGYALGSSSSLFNTLCGSTINTADVSSSLNANLAAILLSAHQQSNRDQFAVYPNPFNNYARSSLVASQTELFLVDGGEALQNNPIFPLLQPSRGVDVIIVNDNSADSSDNFPNGTEILTTYVQATNNAGLTRMPFIPSVDTFISEGLDKRPTFFGCNDSSKITIVYLPNVNYTFPSNQPTAKLQYSASETEGMIIVPCPAVNEPKTERL